ncbi:hypothetical protein Salat_2729800 [Sesamum alatum]|uniref:Uncharacterized protein n=1 Tax=Sesamum alatum TaxID=300844 RepID=A0AAE1XKL6_9LAMI|nr:hypothetical protein Salat_2729800 [Sesamum alatum]
MIRWKGLGFFDHGGSSTPCCSAGVSSPASSAQSVGCYLPDKVLTFLSPTLVDVPLFAPMGIDCPSLSPDSFGSCARWGRGRGLGWGCRPLGGSHSFFPGKKRPLPSTFTRVPDSRPPKKPNLGPSQFKFEASWARYAECAEIISDAWLRGQLGESRFVAVDCLAQCSEALSLWSNSRFQGVKRRLKWLEQRICQLELSQWSVGVATELSDC